MQARQIHRAVFAVSLVAGLCLSAAGGYAAEPAKIAEFRLRGPITETPPPEFAMFSFGEDRAHALKDIVARLKKARLDSDVAAVVLTLDDPEMGWAQMQELREALLAVRAADKDVYCQIESVRSGMYLLASAASRLSIVPTGDIGLMGLHAESPYLKGLLDKIHVEADMEHVGEYKGAAEPLLRTGPSKEAEEQTNWLLDDMFEQIVEGVAKTRGLAPERVRALIDEGPFMADAALEAGLVDAVEYRQDFLEKIRGKHGESAKFVRNYGGREGPEVDFSSPFALFEMIGKLMTRAEEGSKPAVAVIYVDGMIVSGRSEEGLFGSRTAGSTTLRAALDKARKDESIKAVVMRVDSPGGSALASEIIWNAAQRCGEDKPFVVSMGNVAASGGYYVACGADAIFADAGTITGSIGVVGGKLITKGLWDWAGVTFHETKRGRNADLFNSNRRFDERERAIIRKMMEDIYAVFTDHVKDGRGEKLTEDIEKIARGRVYTGRLAQAKGLVDKLGGLDDAIKYAADQANMAEYDIRVLPRSKGLFDLFREGLGVDEDDEDVSIGAAAMGRSPVSAPAAQLFGAALRHMEPARARMVTRWLLRLDLLGREHVLTVLPTEFLVNGMGW
ncbi:MAG: signal peptide peptidase SppA [Phycisphaerae bacterium]|nr:signal peptide peptidase SppA [Phycisphaerae bacterium]